jgi:hypothetical protein
MTRRNGVCHAEIIAFRDSGATFAEVGDKFGFSRQRAEQICHANGAPRLQRHPDIPGRNAAIIARFRNGIAAVEIASEFGVKRSLVFAICRGKVGRWERYKAKERRRAEASK